MIINNSNYYKNKGSEHFFALYLMIILTFVAMVKIIIGTAYTTEPSCL